MKNGWTERWKDGKRQTVAFICSNRKEIVKVKQIDIKVTFDVVLVDPRPCPLLAPLAPASCNETERTLANRELGAKF